MPNKSQKDYRARTLNTHDLTIRNGVIVCKACGKTDDEIDEQNDPIVCWAERDE
jgi:hypothetical protein